MTSQGNGKNQSDALSGMKIGAENIRISSLGKYLFSSSKEEKVLMDLFPTPAKIHSDISHPPSNKPQMITSKRKRGIILLSFNRERLIYLEKRSGSKTLPWGNPVLKGPSRRKLFKYDDFPLERPLRRTFRWWIRLSLPLILLLNASFIIYEVENSLSDSGFQHFIRLCLLSPRWILRLKLLV